MKSLGFGIERLGLLPIKAPALTFFLLALFTAFCVSGVKKLETDDALSDLFRSSSKVYQDYQAMSDLFPSSERDVLVMVEGDNLLDPKALEQIRNVHLELQFVESVDGALSIFSMRGPPNSDGYAAPIIPEDIPKFGEGFEVLEKVLKEHPLIYGKLLSKPQNNKQIALIILSIKNEVVKSSDINKAVDEIMQSARDALDVNSKLNVELAGIPIMRKEIKSAIKRDRLIFNTLGFTAGFIICLGFFRRPKLVFIASMCPALSVLWSLGLLGHMGFKLNTFINVIPPLVMVIAFSDAMHLVFSIRRNIAKGHDRFAATREAVLNVGPACVLTSLTTSLALITLALTDSGLIRQFGFAAALATLMAFVAVILIIPTLTSLMMGDEDKFRQEEEFHGKALKHLDHYSNKIASWITPRHLAFSIVGISMVILFTILHTQLRAQYRLSDQVPAGKQSSVTNDQIDQMLQGATPLHILLQWPKDKSLRKDAEILDAVETAHSLMEEQGGVANVWSVAALRRWLKENGNDSPKAVGEYLDKMPIHLLNRFVNEKQNAAIITGRLPNLDAKDTLPIIDSIESELNKKLDADHGFTIRVTGLSSVSALQSSTMIDQLNQGLMTAVIMVIFLIGLAFRSFHAGLLSIVPNLLPVVAAGAGLFLRDAGLEYASVIGLTVSFGLAVDDTIHFLNRLYLEKQKADTTKEAVYNTLAHIGPVLMLTTIVLVLGLAVTVLSQLPPMRLFGSLAMTTLFAALLADLFVLPAIILSTNKSKVSGDAN